MQRNASCRVVFSSLLLAAWPTAALAQSGALDSGFGTNGVVVTDLIGAGNASYYGWAAARNPSSGDFVLAAGVTGSEGHEQWSVMRFRADGTRDLAFGTQGMVRTDFQTFDADPDHPSDVAFDTSGAAAQHRILVAGYATVPDPANYNFPAEHLAVAAYRPDGTLDPSFAGSGKFLLGGTWSARALTVDATPDGKTVVTGLRDGDLVVLRLLHDGSLDGSFASGGIATVSTGGANLVAAAMQPDGGIVLGLQGYSYYPVFTSEVTLTRLSPAGIPDASFGSEGTRLLSGERLSGLVARGDGTLIGLHPPVDYGGPFTLRVYGANGATLGSDTLLAPDFTPSSMDVGGDGSVVLGGNLASNYAVFAVAKTTPFATLDAAFDADGYATLDLGGYQSATHALALPGGAAAVVGLRNDPLDFAASFVIGRLQADGAEDLTFAGGAGFGAFPPRASSQDSAQDIAVHQADGKLVVLARTLGGGGYSAVLRYLPDGTLDPTFGQSGVRSLSEPALSGVAGTGIGLQSNGRIVVTGLRQTYLGSAPWVRWDLVAAGLDPDGALDPSFGGDGIAEAYLPGAQYSFGGGIAVQTDDRILACTTCYVTYPDSEMGVVRFLANGALDTSFGTNGVAWIGSPGASAGATSLAVAADGRIAVGGKVETPYPDYAAYVALAWLSSSGSLLSGPATSVPGFGVDVAVDAAGRALVAAQRFWGTPVYDSNWNVIEILGASPWPQSALAVVRVLPGGALDASFGTAGVASMAVPSGDSAYATTLALQPDGCIVLAGSATLQPTPTTWANDLIVLRLMAGGAPDTSFSGDGAVNADVGPYDAAQSVLLQSDGKIVVVGTAVAYGSYYNQKSDLVLLRILGLNSPDTLVEALIEEVRVMAAYQELKQGQAQSMKAKLQAALNQIDNGNYGPATNQLNAFRQEVLAFCGAKILSSADAAYLLARTDVILAMLVPAS